MDDNVAAIYVKTWWLKIIIIFFLVVLYVCRGVAHVKYKCNRSTRSLFEKFMRNGNC